MPATSIDYYQTLGVARDADGATIKGAYRKLAMQHHPDRNPGCGESEGKFKAISEAYDCLKDPQKRAAYDQYGHERYTQAASGGGGGRGHPGGHGGGDFADLGDIFETIFGGFAGGGGGRQQARRGADLRYNMEITLDEAFEGAERQITIETSQVCGTCEGKGAEPGTGMRTCNLCKGVGQVRAQQGFFMVERTCPNCHGRGQVIETPCRNCRGEGRVDEPQTLDVTIPPGVDTGTRIRLSGKGEAGPFGSPPGDLYIFLRVKPHKVFERDGSNLVTEVPITFTTAALGGSIDIPNLDGETVTIDIPAGIQSGKQLRKRGAGMPVLQARGRGDLIVEILVETPTKLSKEQKDILARFRETETGDECPNSKGFFERLKDVIAG